MPRDVSYRLAVADDAPAIAALHADSWRRHYRGMFPDDYLDNDADADRAQVWHRRLHDPEPGLVTITIVAEREDALAGFAHSMLDDDPEFGTLLDNLHVRHDAQRLGIGRRLMAETATRLRDAGSASSLYLWVLEGNTQARRFYEVLDGKSAGTGQSSAGRSSSPSIRIWWPDPAVLLAYGRESAGAP